MIQYWVIQQGTNYFVVASATKPDLTVPEGVRRKVILAIEAANDVAQARAQELATLYNGTYLPTAP